MTLKRLDRLVPVVRARYEAEFSAIRGILADETQCRSEMARLENLARQVADPLASPGPMQIIGADVLFQKSLAGNRARLNADLARILARKVEAMDRVRLAFGQKEAIEAILSDAIADLDKARAARRAEAALSPWLTGTNGGIGKMSAARANQ